MNSGSWTIISSDIIRRIGFNAAVGILPIGASISIGFKNVNCFIKEKQSVNSEIKYMKALVNKSFTIEHKPGKGGWHYAIIPDIPVKYKNQQGLVRVKGFIDTYEVRQFNLLPVKTGEMMLVLKASLRKSINKKAGDKVHVKLFWDESKVEIPADVLDSLLQSEEAYTFFLTLTESNKKYYIDWIADAKTLDTKVTRIVKMIQQLEHKRKFWDWPSRG